MAEQSAQTEPFRRGRETVISYPVQTAGVRIRILEAGEGGRVLFCLHGTGSRADRFTPPVPGLTAAGFHVYAMDFPGHGFADKPEDFEYSAASFARVVIEVMDALGLSGATLLGTSLGAHVAARVACDRPDLARDLVLIGATGIASYPKEFNRDPESVAKATPEAIRAKLEFLVSDPAAVSAEWVREEGMINSSKGANHALLSTATYLNDGTNGDLQASRLNDREFDHDVLLVWGRDDQWTPLSMGEEAKAALTNATLVTMQGCGHAPYFEDPDAFVEIMVEHLVD